MPALRERKEDINLLIKKFGSDFSEEYKTPSIRLDQEAINVLSKYQWPGNIRQLKNFIAQLSVIETERNISSETVLKSLPKDDQSVSSPILFEEKNRAELSEREILYKVLFDMKKDLTELKKITFDLINNEDREHVATELFKDIATKEMTLVNQNVENETLEIEETFSLANQEKNLIKKSLEKHNGRRKLAAEELGISERTLYRKIKEFNL